LLPAIIQALLLHSIKLKCDDDSIAANKPNLIFNEMNDQN